jgi:hypothetical protein
MTKLAKLISHPIATSVRLHYGNLAIRRFFDPDFFLHVKLRSVKAILLENLHN